MSKSRSHPARGARESLELRRSRSAAADQHAPRAAFTPARQMEFLSPGLVAINRGNGNAYLSWRLLGTDPANIAFNVYRITDAAPPGKRNASPITATTDFSDTGA